MRAPVQPVRDQDDRPENQTAADFPAVLYYRGLTYPKSLAVGNLTNPLIFTIG